MMFKMFLLILCTYIAIYIANKADYNYSIPFNVAVKEGIIVAAIIGITMGLANVIYIKVIDPTYLDVLAEQGRENLIKSGKSTEEIQDAIDRFHSFNAPWVTIIKEIAFNLFLGVICSLIITFMIRRIPVHE